MAVVGILRSHRQLAIDPKEISNHIESVIYDHRDASSGGRCEFRFDSVTKSGYD